MYKVDLHTHILPPQWPNLAERWGDDRWVTMAQTSPCCAKLMCGGQTFREIESNCWDPQRRLEECDANGVDVQVLSTVPVMFSYWADAEKTLELARILNDHVAQVVREFPTRFLGLGTVPLQDPDISIAELERCVGELGLAGVQIGTHVNGLNLDDDSIFPVLEAAEAIGAAVFVHPWDMLGALRMEKYWLRWLVGMPAETALAMCSVIFSGILDRLPKLRIAFAHGGGGFPNLLGRIVHGFQVRPDLCAIDNCNDPRTYLDRLYVDSLVHEPLTLNLLVQLFGCDRIALGSDYPFPLGEAKPGTLVESLPELTHNERRRIMAGTALEFLGIDATHTVAKEFQATCNA